MAEIKLPRLGKAASEFNISTQTVIDLLHSKGLDIENNINSKLSEDQYAVLINEYQREKEVKQKAQEIVIGTLPNVQPEKKEIPSTKKAIEKKPIFKTEPIEKVPAPKVEEKEEVVIAEKAEIAQPAEESAIIEEKKTESGIKILGKIELPEKKKPKTPAPAKETPKKEVAKEKKADIAPKTVEVAEKQMPPQTEVPELPQQPQGKKEEPQPAKTEHYETSVEHLQGTKVVGTLDLSSFASHAHHKHSHKDRNKGPKGKPQNLPQQPQNKDYKKPEVPATPKIVAPQTAPKSEPPAPHVPEHYAMKVAVLQGPKILGKIELPVEKKPEKGKPYVNKDDA
ncbi:MAG: hypothetical protein LBV46_02605, partial [Bacteroidales bacterium]|nr:hypothetical protein [Bacteroidales bacterium]